MENVRYSKNNEEWKAVCTPAEGEEELSGKERRKNRNRLSKASDYYIKRKWRGK